MTTKLASLKSRLTGLRHRRWLARLATGASALLTTFLLSCIAAFVCDWSLDLTRAQRMVSLLLIAGATVWALVKFALPFWRIRETELDLALLVERNQRIDSDLVAALQFESSDADRWGSPHLRSAVIDYVGEFGTELDVSQGLDHGPLRRRVVLLLCTLALVSGAVVYAPGFATAFLNRAWLGTAHYPTRTRIESIALNGAVIYPLGSAAARAPYGAPLRFEVACGGVMPESGEIQVSSLAGESTSTVKLLLDRTSDPKGRQVYSGEFPRLDEPLSFQAFVGDAWTDPATILAIAVPAVTVELTEVRPAYAVHRKRNADRRSGARQISVVGGSQVVLQATCANKALRSVKVVVAKQEYALRSAGGENKIWKLPREGTPFASVTQPFTYELHVEDTDGLTVEPPIQGGIRIEPDAAPRVVAAVVTAKVVPNARPTISYGATDDYGIAAVRFNVQVVRAGIEQPEQTVPVPSSSPGDVPQTQVRGQYALDLQPLNLAKGDEVRVVVEAVDFRGATPGKAMRSETILLHVTDESGVLADLIEADQKSSRQLDAIIQRQLGIGDAR